MRRVLLCSSLLFCALISTTTIAYAEEGGGKGKGLLTGVLDKAESTVNETTESLGNVLDTGMDGADQTVQDTVTFTTHTVETLIEPSSERRDSDILDYTGEFVEKVVDNVVPVADKSTEAVETVTSTVTKTVKDLPGRTVTPVIDEVTKVVNEDKGAVIDTVENAHLELDVVESVGESFEAVPGNETIDQTDVNQLPSIPIMQFEKNEKNDKPVESPHVNNYLGAPVEDFVTEVNSSETVPSEINEDTAWISKVVSEEPDVRPVNHTGVVTDKVETTADKQIPISPIPSGEHAERFPIVSPTNTTSVSSPLVNHGGNADIVVGIVDENDMHHIYSGRQWVYSDELMRIQWIHAPPGQPPQITPFLPVY